MKNVSDKILGKSKYILCSIFFFENLAVCEIIWEKNLRRQPGHTAHALYCPKDTDRHSEYVILIAFPLQQRLHARATDFIYTHVGCPE